MDDKLNAEQRAFLRADTNAAYADMMLLARVLVIDGANSRAGLAALGRYLEKQFNEPDDLENGCIVSLR
ncbi:MAG: hypothetical protein ACLP1D_00020 [Xanthobacteraceae bacterium]